ncbi:hypothetical protein [Ekhidna sp. To15]|uniref:hypothetical protein n=1 Tax=Ekhidna sp. To15 TaxID=3395267 RepID=UPI003F523027
MKTLLTTIFSFVLVLSLFSQAKTDFNNMEASEIRQFLLQQNESGSARIMIKKHNTSRITAYTMLAGSLVFAVASGDSSGDSGLQSGTIVTGLLAGVMFIGAGLSGIAASERMKKAKSIYLTGGTNATSAGGISIIRDEREIIQSVLKYPTPR